MTPDEWKSIKDIAAGAMSEAESDRAGYLATRCGSDEGLRREVESLLVAAEQAADLYETPAFLISGAKTPSLLEGSPDEPAEPTFAGQRFGPYRIVRELGHGGMGFVYLAERDDDEYRQRVALKVAQTARSETVLRWFRHERQILANLEHPNIARLLDGGTNEAGMPYLVMEYVEGIPIDEYCRREQLSLNERLTLFRQVCAAVEYAHRNLVVHRDLKPRNILVVDGVPKLLDFGIAKLLAAGEDPEAVTHEAGANTAGVMTPEYASPEQIRGEPITTATDVFALGVLLYKLLTDRSPYRVDTNAPLALAAAVCEQEALPPSTVVEGKHARRALRGDLDAIVLKALQKAPASRYATVAQMADDVDRYRTAMPVAARENTVAYRSTKFVARHRIAVSAAGLILATLVGGLGTTLWQARRAQEQQARAERHFNEVRQLASSLIFEVHDGIENLPGAIPTRQLLVKRALDYFDGLAADERENGALQRELASAYDKLAGVLGRPYASNLGDSRAALASYRKALAIREGLAQKSRDRQTLFDLWSSYYNVGGILRETADTQGALTFHGKAHDVVTELLRAAPNDPVLVKARARTAVTRAHTFEQSGRVNESLASAREALNLDKGLLEKNASSNALRSDVATDHGRVGIALLRLGDPQTALQHMRERVRLALLLTAAEPANVAFKRGLSTAHLQLGQALIRNGDAAGAVRAQKIAFDLRQALADQDPADRQAQIDLMFVYLELGQVLARAHDLTQAAEKLRAAVALCDSLALADPNYVFYRLSLASSLTRLSRVLVQQGRAEQSAPLARRASELMETSSAADRSDARLQFELALAYAAIGDAKAVSGERPRSDRLWYERSLQILDEMQRSGALAGGTLLGDEAATTAEIRRKLSAGSN